MKKVLSSLVLALVVVMVSCGVLENDIEHRYDREAEMVVQLVRNKQPVPLIEWHRFYAMLTTTGEAHILRNTLEKKGITQDEVNALYNINNFVVKMKE